MNLAIIASQTRRNPLLNSFPGAIHKGKNSSQDPIEQWGPVLSYSLHRCKESFYCWKITLLGRFYAIREHLAAAVASGQAQVLLCTELREGQKNLFDAGSRAVSEPWKKLFPQLKNTSLLNHPWLGLSNRLLLE